MVFHVRNGHVHGLLAFFTDGQAVPDAVDVLGIQFHFLGIPVDRLGNKIDAQLLADSGCNIDVEADNLVVVVAVAHRREGVIQTEHQLALVEDVLKRLVGAFCTGTCGGASRGGSIFRLAAATACEHAD